MRRRNPLNALIFIVLMLPLQTSSIDVVAIEVTPDTFIEMEDVVKLNYTLWVGVGDPVELINGTLWVHDPNDPEAPNDLYQQFPDLTVPPNIGFMKGILGMKAEQMRTFDVLASSGEGFTNESELWFDEDLTYQVYIEEILLDSTEPPFTIFDLPFFLPLVFLITILLLIIIYYRIKRYSSKHDLFSSKTQCYSCGKKATVKCGNLSCNTPFCKSCFIKNNSCEVCSSNKFVPLSQK